MGISHRDIKPENILIDENWNVKLIDFGFSCKQYNSEDVLRSTVCGTPSYTPPEVLLKTAYSAELMDVWGLGVTLYAMLASELPFESESNEKRKARIINCKWVAKPFFSQRVQKLFSRIFTESSKRITLNELLSNEFVMGYQFKPANYIDFKNETIVLEEAIMTMLDKEYHLDKKKVYESVK